MAITNNHKEVILHVNNLSISAHDNTPLVSAASFALHRNSRVALVGANGCGKSTLMKALVGAEDVSILSGEIALGKKGMLIEYLPQFAPIELLQKTVIDVMIEHLATRRGSFDEDWIAYTTLADVGVSESSFNSCLRDLNGGEVNRVLLARALVVNPDLLLMDEPSNHLDTEGILAFESVIEELKLPFMVISHDRLFLDRFTNQTIFMAYQQLQSFDLPFSSAKKELQHARSTLEQLAREQRTRRDEIAAATHRLQGYAKLSDKMSGAYRASLTKLAHFEEGMVTVPKERNRHIQIRSSDFQGHALVQIENHEVTVPTVDSILFKIDRITISPGDKIGNYSGRICRWVVLN